MIDLSSLAKVVKNDETDKKNQENFCRADSCTAIYVCFLKISLYADCWRCCAYQCARNANKV